MIRQFNENFFSKPEAEIFAAYRCRIDNYLGPNATSYDHLTALHRYGKLPIKIKALKEGTKVPFGVSMLTLCNTAPEFFWVTNMLETIMSAVLWTGCTSATSAHKFRQAFEKFC